jgi:hypothetical protein
MGDQLTIRVAWKDNRPVAAIMTLSFKDTITYKYGRLDERFNHLGGAWFLFWKTIQEAKAEGMIQLDLGRSELDNTGLVKFKDRLGADRINLQYYRSNSGPAPKLVPRSRKRGSRRDLSPVCRTPYWLLLASFSTATLAEEFNCGSAGFPYYVAVIARSLGPSTRAISDPQSSYQVQHNTLRTTNQVLHVANSHHCVGG